MKKAIACLLALPLALAACGAQVGQQVLLAVDGMFFDQI